MIAFAALIALIVWELTTEHPVIDLRLLKDRNFAVSTFMIFMLGVIFYGTTVLLPLLLQTLMGYTAMQSGLVLFPGGMTVLMLMPVVGWVLNRAESRWLVAFGFAMAAFGMTQLSHLNLEVSQGTPVYDWVVSRAGMAFLWVPMNVMAFYYVPREKTNNATGLINLARNIGGSIGISLVTTMLDRRAQFHQNRFVEHLQPGNPLYQAALHRIVARFSLHGFDAASGHHRGAADDVSAAPEAVYDAVVCGQLPHDVVLVPERDPADVHREENQASQKRKCRGALKQPISNFFRILF